MRGMGVPLTVTKGVCPNGLQILHERLEHQMLKHLVENVLRPDMLEHTIIEFQDRIKKSSELFIESQIRVQAELPKLKTELRKLEMKPGIWARRLPNTGPDVRQR